MASVVLTHKCAVFKMRVLSIIVVNRAAITYMTDICSHCRYFLNIYIALVIIYYMHSQFLLSCAPVVYVMRNNKKRKYSCTTIKRIYIVIEPHTRDLVS